MHPTCPTIARLPLVSAMTLAMSMLAGCSSNGVDPGTDAGQAPPHSTAVISGSAVWPEDIALPPGAQLEVLLEDISRADAAAALLGQTRIDAPARPPAEFQLEYDSAGIDPRHSYALRARVSLEGRLLLVTDTVHPVLTSDTQSTQLHLRPVEPVDETALTPDSAVALEDTHWHLIQAGGRDIRDDQQQNPAHLVLQAQEHRAIGSGGCNRYSGSYSLQGESLTFGQLASTMMACMKGMEVEQLLHDVLTQTTGWRIAEGHLEVLNQAGVVLARFEPRIGE